MARGNEILVQSEPRGVHDEGTITDTSKPGTCMEIVPATVPVNGAFSWRAASRSTGSKGPVVILMPDRLQGKLATDAYSANTRCFLYWPVAGEMLNLLVADQAGTSSTEDVAIGDLFAIQSSGKIYHNSSNTSAPFYSLEVIHGWVQADYLLWVQYLGNQA